MSLFGKLNLLRKHCKDNNINNNNNNNNNNKSNEIDDKITTTTTTTTNTTTTSTKTTNNTTKKNTSNDREPTLCLGTEQVRILLFQECEWRGRRVLFDSLKLENRRTKNATSTTGTKEKTAEDTTSSLSEMVFGTVAMTYKGSSFKVHSMKSPACIICTKVFPVTEHNGPKQNERFSDGTLTRCSTHVDSNTSNSSIKTSISRPSSGNVSSSNDLLPDPRKNSSCSSNGSSWDMETQLHMGSSQSLESSGSSGVGSSLSSLRRKWLRAVSTSLSRSDSDDIFGIQQYGDNNSEGGDKHYRSRLGLMMLVRLTQGQERRIETRLLEHMTLLEGMLDRLRYFCIERNGFKYKTNRKLIDPADRMYRASYRFIISLLRLLINPNYFRPPLLWHDVLLNSVITLEMNSNILQRGLQQMCQLLDDVDTKSTNFFLSTVVTAVLMYHLGWVYTILPANDRQMMENLGKWYPCNPLWAQLGDLYGAMGNPIKVTHTLVVGDSRKTDLINSVLYFLTYFIRSGIVHKQQEYRCAIEDDIKEATNFLEQMKIKRPYLFDYTKARNNITNDSNRNNTVKMMKRETRVPIRKQTQTLNQMQVRVNDSATINEQLHVDERTRSESNVERFRSTETSIRSLKRSTTMKVALDQYMLKSNDESSLHESTTPISKSLSTIQDEIIDEEKVKPITTNVNQNYIQSKVKIIVNEIDSDTIDEEITCTVDNQRQFDVDNVTNINKNDEFKDNTNASSFKRISIEEEDEEEEEEQEEECKSKNDNGGINNNNNNNNNNDKSNTTISQTDFLRLNDNNFIEENKRQEQQVYFTLGCEDKPNKYFSRPRLGYNCQCSYMFTTLPSTSAQLPENVLRKIIQRNFPESSKSMEAASSGTMSSMESNMESNMESKSTRICPRCHNQSNASSQTYNGMKELLETPTNATEVLRTCVNADRTVAMSRSNSLETLMEANSVIELPMPRSKLVSSKQVNHSNEETGFNKTLLQTKVSNTRQTNNGNWSTNYTWGLVIQGLIKKDKKRRKRRKDKTEEKEEEEQQQQQQQKEQKEQKDQQIIESDIEDDWWCCVREEVAAGVRFPTIDEPVAEAVCILADLDTWHVGILSNNTPSEGPPLPVGMSRLVANMLEAFSYVWRKYHSPLHCVDILESKLREMWLRSEALAQMLMTADVCDVSVAALTNALDLDAADIPLLLAVATTHSPEIAQRFGLTLA